MTRTAVLIDGNFFLKRARRLWGDTSPEKRASECHAYALRHISAKRKMTLEYGEPLPIQNLLLQLSTTRKRHF